jgi:hypothetical protein
MISGGAWEASTAQDVALAALEPDSVLPEEEAGMYVDPDTGQLMHTGRPVID